MTDSTVEILFHISSDYIHVCVVCVQVRSLVCNQTGGFERHCSLSHLLCPLSCMEEIADSDGREMGEGMDCEVITFPAILRLLVGVGRGVADYKIVHHS